MKFFQIFLKDALCFDSGFVSQAGYICIIYLKIPEQFVHLDAIGKDVEEALYVRMYGANWRNGNEDGSCYQVLSFKPELVDEASEPWKKYQDDKDYRSWFWEFKSVSEIEDIKQNYIKK